VTLLLAWHALVGLVGLALGERLGRRGLLLGVLGPVAGCVWLIANWSELMSDTPIVESIDWIPQLGLNLDLRADGFSALMIVLISGIGVLVYAYASAYFPARRQGLGRLIALLTLFSGSMLGLVLSDNVIVLYGFWELTTITSFLLIGNSHTDGRARAAALQALLITSAGALAMLAGLIVLGQAAGSYKLSEILADPPSGTAVSVALALILLGAFTKSAQYPFHGWLPGAMVAPTPVSAYLHSATMVKAGIYLVARLSPAFAAVGYWQPVVVGVGLFTMIAGGMRALRQTDLKLLLAMSTVSQLGLMMAVFGLGSSSALTAGCVLLIAHGLAKAAAFMVVGELDKQHGSRDTRVIPTIGPGWYSTGAVAVIAAASLAGVPLVFGFIAKESMFEAFIGESGTGAALAVMAAALGSVLTVGYSLRFAFGSLGLLSDRGSALTADVSHGPPTSALVVPGVLLTVATVATGLIPGIMDQLIGSADEGLDGLDNEVHLAIWHGVNQALIVSAIALAGGIVLFVTRRSVDGVLAKLQPAPVSSSGGYRTTLRVLNRVADRVAGLVQSGSLPVYLGVTLLTAAVIPAGLLSTGEWWSGWPVVVDSPWHVPIAAVLLGAALAATVVHRRFTAALFLGVAGYSMAGLFVVQGAPDLALTQVGIESLTTVLFVLVLRRLPDRFESVVPLWRRSVRASVSVVVGATVMVLALATGSQNPATPASDAMVERSLPDGGGRNVVNVILVDFRGYDTLGEITVLAAAAIGMVALARAGRRPGAPNTAGSGVNAVPPPVPVRRLFTLEVSVQLVSVVVLTGSLYLLFAGHNQPGGGFAGGIVAGAAIALRYISGGIGEVRSLSRGRPWYALGAGVMIAALTALVPLLFGGAVLEGYTWTWNSELLGKVKMTSALIFDIGVYLVVIGLVLMLFESFGDDPELTNDDSEPELAGAEA